MSLITKLRTAGTGTLVEAEVFACGFEHVVAWQRLIHDRFIANSGSIDANWDWPAYYLGAHLSEQSLGRQAIAFQLRVADAKGDAVPVSQAILTLPYVFPGDVRQRCVFIWFAAAAPAKALQSFGIDTRFAVIAPILDTAIQLSLSHGLEGRIGLHAALGTSRQQSDQLADKYRAHGLQQRVKVARYLRFPFRKDDDRFFYFDQVHALNFARTQDDLR